MPITHVLDDLGQPQKIRFLHAEGKKLRGAKRQAAIIDAVLGIGNVPCPEKAIAFGNEVRVPGQKMSKASKT